MKIRVAMVVVGIMLLDQATKLLVEENMILGESIPIIPNIFHLTYVHNRGAAFGIFPDQQAFFILCGVIMTLAGLWGMHKFKHYGNFFLYGIAGMIAGALGNLIDRIRIASVVDFFDFRIWPVFNVADIAIVCGAAAIIWSFWQEEKREKVKGKYEQ